MPGDHEEEDEEENNEGGQRKPDYGPMERNRFLKRAHFQLERTKSVTRRDRHRSSHEQRSPLSALRFA